MIDMKKFNLGRLWFPKIVNLWGFISSYIIFDFQLQTANKFFVIEIFGIGDDDMLNSSLFKLYIEWEEYFGINFNLLFLFHLKYEYYNKSDKHSQIYNILENSAYYKNYLNNVEKLKWLKVHQHKSIGINKYIEIRFDEGLTKDDIIYLLEFNGIKKFKLKQQDKNHFKIYNY